MFVWKISIIKKIIETNKGTSAKNKEKHLKKVTLCNDRGRWRSVHTIEGGLGTPNAHDGGTKEEKE